MFDFGVGRVDSEGGEGVGAALLADEHGVALGVVTGSYCFGSDVDEAAVGILGAVCGDAFRDDCGACIFSDVDHFGSGIGLHGSCCEGHGVELADRVVALEDAAGVFPGNGGSGFDLGPGDLGVISEAFAPFCDEVIDAALSCFGVARIPVLDGGVADLRFFVGDEFDDRCVELIGGEGGCGASFEVADRGALFGDDEGAFKLAALLIVHAEVGGELHRAADAFGDKDEGAIGEDGGVERGEEVIGHGNDAAEILLDQFGKALDGFGDGAEDHACLFQLFLECGSDGDGVKDEVDGYIGKSLLLIEGDTEFFEGGQDGGIGLIEAGELRFFGGGGVVGDGLVVDGRVVDAGPRGLLRFFP